LHNFSKLLEIKGYEVFRVDRVAGEEVPSDEWRRKERRRGIPRSHKTASSPCQTIRESGDDLEQGRI
ncbi:hypothetical protein, partial [Klebsiella pneumoniae]|uniref:hypothetical protein n=1 Tax=Klebsiella pneumoniae TaxID=573 RepID=UPI003013AA3E